MSLLKFLDVKDVKSFEGKLNFYLQKLFFIRADKVSKISGGAAIRTDAITTVISGGDASRTTTANIYGGKA